MFRDFFVMLNKRDNRIEGKQKKKLADKLGGITELFRPGFSKT